MRASRKSQNKCSEAEPLLYLHYSLLLGCLITRRWSLPGAQLDPDLTLELLLFVH